MSLNKTMPSEHLLFVAMREGIEEKRALNESTETYYEQTKARMTEIVQKQFNENAPEPSLELYKLIKNAEIGFDNDRDIKLIKLPKKCDLSSLMDDLTLVGRPDSSKQYGIRWLEEFEIKEVQEIARELYRFTAAEVQTLAHNAIYGAAFITLKGDDFREVNLAHKQEQLEPILRNIASVSLICNSSSIERSRKSLKDLIETSFKNIKDLEEELIGIINGLTLDRPIEQLETQDINRKLGLFFKNSNALRDGLYYDHTERPYSPISEPIWQIRLNIKKHINDQAEKRLKAILKEKEENPSREKIISILNSIIFQTQG